MAYIEFNALSTILCGSFTLRIFLPEMGKMALDDSDHEVKYPVMYMLHDDGGFSGDWIQSSAEQIAMRYGMFVVCPDAHHTLGSNMVYGPKFEDFVTSELPGICRNCFPVTTDPHKSWLGGVGTGGYGMLKTYLKHKQLYAGAVSINGLVDMAGLADMVLHDEPTEMYQNRDSLEAVFGNLHSIKGSSDDLYMLAEITTDVNIYLYSPKGSARFESNRKLSELLQGRVKLESEDLDSDGPACFRSLNAATAWLMEGKEGN